MKPLISVVIPFYRGVHWLCEAVESVMRQTYTHFQVIVVNDGSPENMDWFLQKYHDKVIYLTKPNGGPAEARNVGIDAATGEYIAFLDADDLWMPHKLEKQLDLMMSHEYVWSHTSYGIFSNETGQIAGTVDVGRYNGTIYPLCVISSPIATPCVMVKSEVLRGPKGLKFPTSMRYGEDVGLWARLASQYPIGVLNEMCTLVRMRGSNASRRARVQLRSRSQTYEMISDRGADHVDRRRLPLRILRLFRACHAIDSLLSRLEQRGVSEWVVEFIAKVLYFPIWAFFRCERHYLLRGKRK